MYSKSELFDEIVRYFSEQYSWLGEQYAKELLYCVAANIIQTYMPIKERIRSHLLLFWDQGWFKSSLLFQTYRLLGKDMAQQLVDITSAVFRGSVEAFKTGEVVFIPPECKNRRFIVITELGTITKSSHSEELNQIFLNALEEGIINVSLLKIAKLSEEEKKEISAKYGVLFDVHNPAMMYYVTKTSFLAATYDLRYTVDEAFLSRWNIMIPIRPLNNRLTEYVMTHKVDDDEYKDVIRKFRDLIYAGIDNDTQERIYDVLNKGLPSNIFRLNVTIHPRIAKELQIFILANVFWNKELSYNDLEKRLFYHLSAYEAIHTTPEDIIIKVLRENNTDANGNLKGLSFDELATLTNIPRSKLSSILRRTYNIQKYNDGKTIRYFAVQ